MSRLRYQLTQSNIVDIYIASLSVTKLQCKINTMPQILNIET